MKIDLDNNYYLQTEGLSTTLYKKRIVKSGPNTGQEQTTFIGCFARFSQALGRYVEERLGEMTPGDIPDLIQRLDDVEKTIQKVAKQLDMRLISYQLTRDEQIDD